MVNLPPTQEAEAMDAAKSKVAEAMDHLPSLNPYRALSQAGQKHVLCLCSATCIDWSELHSVLKRWKAASKIMDTLARPWPTDALVTHLVHNWLACIVPLQHKQRSELLTRVRVSSNTLPRGYRDYSQVVAGAFDVAVTARGFSAAVPRDIEPGDNVVSAYGSEYSVVLRGVDQNRVTFHGLAYVKGTIDGKLVGLCSRPAFRERDFVLC
ncbi:hypothetical protein MBLNU230_g3266t1 [Neophaeotheca triangularis]